MHVHKGHRMPSLLTGERRFCHVFIVGQAMRSPVVRVPRDVDTNVPTSLRVISLMIAFNRDSLPKHAHPLIRSTSLNIAGIISASCPIKDGAGEGTAIPFAIRFYA